VRQRVGPTWQAARRLQPCPLAQARCRWPAPRSRQSARSAWTSAWPSPARRWSCWSGPCLRQNRSGAPGCCPRAPAVSARCSPSCQLACCRRVRCWSGCGAGVRAGRWGGPPGAPLEAAQAWRPHRTALAPKAAAAPGRRQMPAPAARRPAARARGRQRSLPGRWLARRDLLACCWALAGRPLPHDHGSRQTRAWRNPKTQAGRWSWWRRHQLTACAPLMEHGPRSLACCCWRRRWRGSCWSCCRCLGAACRGRA
jgi:hypothetical protein